MSLKELATRIKEDGTWSLFLDRDGTINERLPGLYVSSYSQFKFIPSFLENIATLSQQFQHLIVVTNQQGIGKEIMTVDHLDRVHTLMNDEIIENGGFIDEIYHCPFLAIEDPICRKPNPGMGLQAKQDFPNIEFKRSVMIGDSQSDIDFGRLLGMKTIWMKRPNSASEAVHGHDFVISGFDEFAYLF